MKRFRSSNYMIKARIGHDSMARRDLAMDYTGNTSN